MTTDVDIEKTVFARGFILSQEKARTLNERLPGKLYADNLSTWTKTFFGPCTLWVDPLLNYARNQSDRFGVGVLGLCLNPFDGQADNQSIADALFEALEQGRDRFFDYVDQLSGAFIIIYRENADVYLLQDAAATKPVYYHRTADGLLTAAGHIALLQHICGLKPDPRAETVYTSDIYRKDPSRYLPGMVTPLTDALPLTANNQLAVSTGRSERFFPRQDLAPRPLDDQIISEVADIMVAQARLLGAMGRPMALAVTGGRDSRTSAVAFSGQPNLSYYSFQMPTIGHLSEDVVIARKLAEIEKIELNIYELETYKDPDFLKALETHSPRDIWPEAALCYLREFTPDTIHIRSTVSEIGRVFYSRRTAKTVTAKGLARIYTRTGFHKDPMVIETMQDFIDLTNFDTSKFFNYDLHDMFYWEHRNAKWQNILCAEAEMATDVFVPFNNRKLLQLFMAVPYADRLHANLHKALCHKLKPEFDSVEIAS